MKSAVRNNMAKIFGAVFLLLVFFSCMQKNTTSVTKNSGEEILSLTYSNVGGMQGSYRTFTATKDSIKFENGQSVNNIHKEWRAKMSPENWKKLTSTLDVKTLSKITSSPSMQPVDGIDETFKVNTTRKTQVFVNSYNDKINYSQLQNLKTKFEKMLPKEYK
ncbi:hypothetical protein ASG01_07265 [Chryseobacterium sp. Leaf180]|uniref:hypothetical protein n=1 Tax=Chryseobacterium sp. Leaf180 TaxID=1736289 RepID=UPI0006F9F52A|nr:hypothetical protein [Chryseobacterium sp. Leaf180]KQR93670.1 hypothetical protein ASG01_07265 [Chryseobacterium sp. Leaf180]